MNCTIKFRGIRIDNGEWVYGDLLQTNEGSVCIGIHGQYIDDGMHFNDFYDETPYIDEDTLGQFTGLLDKNGKEIYEGDMFTVNGKYPKLIEYRQEYAGFCMANTYDLEERPYIEPWQQIRPDWWNDYKREIMLIGNIHDHPELLNEK